MLAKLYPVTKASDNPLDAHRTMHLHHGARLASNLVGRDRVVTQVMHTLVSNDAPHTLVISGESGVGKTAVTAAAVQVKAAYGLCHAAEALTQSHIP